jgi:hypothetical protein
MTTLPFTAKTAGSFTTNGSWQLVALGGDAVFNSDDRVHWNITPDTTSPSESVEGIVFRWFPDETLHRHDIALKSDEYLWLKSSAGTIIQGIVTDPAP